MKVAKHPTLNILVREDGCVYLPMSGTHRAHWTFGSKNHYGYRTVKIAGKDYLVHRLAVEAFLQFPIPEGMEIDHRNRIRDDNRVFENLRIVTPSANRRNRADHDRVDAIGGTHKYEDARAFNREQCTRYRAEHPEKVRECHTRYYSNNRENERERTALYRRAKRKTHRQVRLANGSQRWVPHADAEALLVIPLSQRIFKEYSHEKRKD